MKEKDGERKGKKDRGIGKEKVRERRRERERARERGRERDRERLYTGRRGVGVPVDHEIVFAQHCISVYISCWSGHVNLKKSIEIYRYISSRTLKFSDPISFSPSVSLVVAIRVKVGRLYLTTERLF